MGKVNKRERYSVVLLYIHTCAQSLLSLRCVIESPVGINLRFSAGPNQLYDFQARDIEKQGGKKKKKKKETLQDQTWMGSFY